MPDPITTAENNYASREEKRTAAYEKARRQLYDDFMRGFKDPTRMVVMTPAWGVRVRTLTCVVEEILDDTSISELLAIVYAASKGEDVSRRAAVWIAERASYHADFHADDLMESDDE